MNIMNILCCLHSCIKYGNLFICLYDFKKKEKDGARESTASRMIALYPAKPGLMSGTPYVPPGPTRSDLGISSKCHQLWPKTNKQ